MRDALIDWNGGVELLELMGWHCLPLVVVFALFFEFSGIKCQDLSSCLDSLCRIDDVFMANHRWLPLIQVLVAILYEWGSNGNHNELIE